MAQPKKKIVSLIVSWDDVLLRALLTRVVDQLRSDALAYETALECGEEDFILQHSTITQLEADDCARKILVDDVDKVVSVLRKMK